VRRALVLVVLAAAAVSIPGCHGRPRHRAQREPAPSDVAGSVDRRSRRPEPGPARLAVDVSRRAFARSLRGKPRVRHARGSAKWLRMRRSGSESLPARSASCTSAPFLGGAPRRATTRRSCS
jgi:hypothetical protein